MLAAADCELLGRQVGTATATDEVEDTEIDVDSVREFGEKGLRYHY